jgi:hypothetical protein
VHHSRAEVETFSGGPVELTKKSALLNELSTTQEVVERKTIPIKSFTKIILAAGVIAIGSASFGGPVFAAVKLGSDHLARLAGSVATESSVLALLGTGFLFVASAVRRLRTAEN